MEVFLNLSWLAVAFALFAGVIVAGRRGLLGVSLKVALGCTALLALLLFPAISMTDDLQQVQMATEWRAGHSVALEDHVDLGLAVSPLVALRLLLVALLAALFLQVWMREALVKLRPAGWRRACAVRPPPAGWVGLRAAA